MFNSSNNPKFIRFQNGWNLYCNSDASGEKIAFDSGFKLTKVMHNEFLLAREISVVGVAITFEKHTKNGVIESIESVVKYFELTQDNFYISNLECTDYSELKSKKGVQYIYKEDLFQFNDYPANAVIKGHFSLINPNFGLKTASPLLTTNIDVKLFSLDISYIFCDYGKSPPHEPGDVILAARLFPSIKFSFLNNESFDAVNNTEYFKLKAVRFDYRFNFSLDYFVKPLERLVDPLLKTIDFDRLAFKEQMNILNNNRPNKAGIFRDKEDLGLWDNVNNYRDSKNIFEAGEKPLIWEIATMGLDNGKIYKDNDVKIPNTWDNVHWWSGYRNTKKVPSAPGAFHALHIHWRWGRIVGKPSPWESFLDDTWLTRLLPAKGQEQFIGLPKYMDSNDFGGPLLDPQIPNQTIRFVIAKNSILPLNAPLKDDFFESFKSKRKIPVPILSGDNITLWYSIEVNREEKHIPKETFRGSVFVHGMYFAHEAEIGDRRFKPTLGFELPPHPSKVLYTWERYPFEEYYL